MQFEEEKKKNSYFNTRVVYNEQGQQLQWNDTFTSIVYNRELMTDPRLAQYRRGSQPLFVVTPRRKVTPVSASQTDNIDAAVTIPTTVPGN